MTAEEKKNSFPILFNLTKSYFDYRSYSTSALEVFAYLLSNAERFLQKPKEAQATNRSASYDDFYRACSDIAFDLCISKDTVDKTLRAWQDTGALIVETRTTISHGTEFHKRRYFRFDYSLMRTFVFLNRVLPYAGGDSDYRLKAKIGTRCNEDDGAFDAELDTFNYEIHRLRETVYQYAKHSEDTLRTGESAADCGREASDYMYYQNAEMVHFYLHTDRKLRTLSADDKDRIMKLILSPNSYSYYFRDASIENRAKVAHSTLLRLADETRGTAAKPCMPSIA